DGVIGVRTALAPEPTRRSVHPGRPACELWWRFALLSAPPAGAATAGGRRRGRGNPRPRPRSTQGGQDMSEAIGQPGQAALPRPLGIGEILSTAWRLYQRHWRTLLAIAAVVVVP